MDARVSSGIRLVLAVVGLLISGYLTLLHYDAHVPLACVNVGIIDCAGVLTSPQSQWFHIPVAAFGLLWFVVAIVLAALGRRDGAAHTWSLIWAVIGACTVVFLVYDELIVIGRICAWCTLVHLIVLTSLVLVVLTPAAA